MSEEDLAQGGDEAELLEAATAFVSMQKLEGWQRLQTLLQTRIDTDVIALAAPRHLRSKEQEWPSDEFLRGAIFGLQLCFSLPKQIIERANEVRAQIDERLMEEED